MKTVKLFEKYTNINSISGNEQEILNQIKKDLKLYDDLIIDNFGNYIFHYNNNKKRKILINGHVDEVGFIVNYIKKDGMIVLHKIGGIDNKNLNDVCILINELEGVLNYNEKNNELILDLGFKNKKEASQYVNIGDFASFKNNFRNINDKIFAKSLDNKYSVVMMIEIEKLIKSLDCDVYYFFSRQEEAGLRGSNAFTTNKNIQVDYAIVLDVSPEIKKIGELEKGVLIRHKDPRTIIDKEMLKKLMHVINKNKIKYQNYFSKGLTDANMISLGQEKGIKTINIGIPGRNMHMQNGIISINDYNQSKKLIIEFLNYLTNKDGV